ncbi:NAD(P)-binding domain-containing protein [Sinomonas sp. JGH33]|uniref:NAD(P)-binding domain-containing protein n=1 Tax=Sinomonas terricola TaxID=3110330 RepID=A0ABU5TBP5_9MICC|nr:NAD(P)-binding domain-containing protein [Sinomonas sp. JGH33]MEA5456935.1 NAD(P)-binding domain-containing protein [Sinomonas sp. JGH33]
MKIAVLGTGKVGRVLAARLAGLGHDVVIGTRDPGRTMGRTEPDDTGALPYAQWQAEHPDVRLLAFPDAGAHAEVVVNATRGAVSLDALNAVGADNLGGKVVLDLALPLDFSDGMPPTLTVANTDSLGEQVQCAFPNARVVKSLTSVFCEVMVDPGRIPGEHSIFLAGNDDVAKKTVQGILDQFGWPAESILDLGDITGARAVEMYSRLFFTLAEMFGSFELNINVIPGSH